MAAMLIDHLKYAQSETIQNLYYASPIVHTLLGYIGRLALPIFIMGIASGYRHTRNVKKYILRLAVFGAVAQIPYYLLFYRGEPVWDMDLNIMFSFVLGLLAIWAFDTLRKKNIVLACLPVALFAVLGLLLRTEGNWRTVVMVFLFYIMNDLKKHQKALLWIPILLILRSQLIMMAFTDPRMVSVVLLNVLGFYLSLIHI